MPTKDLPEPTPGATLAEKRKGTGITQVALAREIGIGRITLTEWEKRQPLDGLRVARYLRALDDLVDRALA